MKIALQAPELRLGVYEALLVAAQATHKREGLHPAILRTSKQVYSEAMPILYKKNKFRARVLYFEQPAWSTPSGLKLVCTLAIEGSGGKPSFHHRMHTGYVAILRSLFEHPSTMHMLRMLTRLNIDFDLTTSQKQRELKRYSFMACDTMKGLCLSLSGNSKLKELSIVAKLGDQDSSDADLADILWPLLLLRDDIAVEFKGVTTDPANMSTTEAERTTEIDAAFCSQIALVKQLCIAELERPGWDGRCWAFHGIRDAEKALHAFKAPGKKLLCLNDIVNKSPVWKGLRREIERAEASGLGQ